MVIQLLGLRHVGFYLFDKLNASLQIHTKVNENPVNALPLILFLLEYEHVVVEKLLQPLVGEIDAKLLKAVELKTTIKLGGNTQLYFGPLHVIISLTNNVSLFCFFFIIYFLELRVFIFPGVLQGQQQSVAFE